MSLSPESNTEVPTPIMTDLQDIASMIQINEEATVSRTVMHAEGVRLVLFSFDKDEILSEHTAAMPVILHTSARACRTPYARSSPRSWPCTCWIAASVPRPEAPTLCGGPRPREVMHEAGARLSYPRGMVGASAPHEALLQRRLAGAASDQPEADLDNES